MIELLLFVHIFLFVFSFAFTAGISIFLDALARRGDAGATHTAFTAARPLAMAGGIGWILTAAAGGALASADGLSMTAPWLLGSYAAFAVLIIAGFGLHAPWQAKVAAASATPGPELNALLKAPIHRVASLVSTASILTIVYLMTARPG